MMCRGAVIFTALVASALSVINVNKALWKSTDIEVSSITAGAHVEVIAPTEFLCRARALQQFNSSLYCSARDRCIVSFAQEKQVTMGIQQGPWSCKCLEPSCPDDFEPVGSVGCFHFSTIGKLLNDSKTECQNMGATLATVSALSELEAVTQYLKRRNIDRDIDYHVDFLRLNSTHFEWGDGTLLSSASNETGPCMGPGEPVNTPDYQCTAMTHTYDFYLYDISCTLSYFICRV